MTKILLHPSAVARANNLAAICKRFSDALDALQSLPEPERSHMDAMIGQVSAREAILLCKVREFLMRSIDAGELIIAESHTMREMHALLADINDILEGISYDTK